MSRAVIGCLLLAATVVVAAAPPPAHVDHEGSPLPPDAVARLGSARMRHGQGVGWLALSRDLKYSASYNGETNDVRVWDNKTGKLLHAARVEEPTGGQMAFADSGELFVYGAGDRSCHVIDAATGARRRFTWEGPMNVGQMSVRPDGKALAVDDADGSLHVIGTKDGKEIAKLALPGAGAGAGPQAALLSWSPDGERLAALYTDRNLSVWDVRGKVRSGTLDLGMGGMMEGGAEQMVFADDGKRLGLLSSGRVQLFDGKTLARVPGFEPAVREYMHFGADAGGKALVAFSGEGQLYRIDLATGKDKQITADPIANHEGQAAIAGGMTLMSREGCLVLIDHKTGKPVHADLDKRRPVFRVRLSATGKAVLVGTEAQVSTWDVATSRLESSKKYGLAELQPQCIDVSPDGRILVVSDPVGMKLSARDLKADKELWSEKAPEGEEMGMSFLKFSPDGKALAVLTMSGSSLFTVRDAETGKVRISKGVEEIFGEPRWSEDGRQVALVNMQRGQVVVYEVGSGEVRRRVRAPMGATAVFRPDGRLLAVGDQQGVLRLVPLVGGGRTREVVVSNQMVSAMAFSRDGKYLAAAGDKIVRVYDGEGRPVASFAGHDAPVADVAFSRDGRTLVSASFDGTALVWRMPTGKEFPPLEADAADSWADLAADAETAGKAVADMVRRGGPSVEALATKLTPIVSVSPDVIAKHIAALDADTASERRAAAEALARLDQQPYEALKVAFKAAKSAEQRRTIRRLLDTLETPSRSGDVLRQMRAVEVLELVGTPAARKVLERLASGGDGRLTREAKAALARLAE